jgi:FMN phosphatase YigB (HAD superfamily)
LLSLFKVTIFSDEIGWRKPHPSVFAAAANGLGLRADECVHIGDDPWTDGHGAKLAGFGAILLTGGQHAARPQPSAHDDRATGPDAKVDGLTDLPAAIAALNRRHVAMR